MTDLWEHVDLCSGIGGFSLGFQWAKLSEPVLFCEIDEYCQKVLKKHWPNVPICNDVKELADDTNAFIPRSNGRKRILTAGYPCQPFSVAGQKRGTEDPRHIWPWILRIIQQERFDVCVFENVAGHISLGLDEVLHDLQGSQYQTRVYILPAEACGAPHKRERLWIIARNLGNANDNGSSTTEIRGSNGEDAEGSQKGEIKTKQFEGTSGRENHDDVGNAQGIGRGKVGNINQKEGVGKSTASQSSCPGADVADTRRKSTGSQEKSEWASSDPTGRSSLSHARSKETNGDVADQQPTKGKQAAQQRLGRVADGLSAWLDEPLDIPRVASGQKDRTHRLKALGNAIVPQIAQRIGIAIRESF